jgi:hypothetical protein
MKKVLFTFALLILSFQLFAETDCRINFRISPSEFFMENYSNVGNSLEIKIRYYTFTYKFDEETKLHFLKIENYRNGDAVITETKFNESSVIYDDGRSEYADLRCRVYRQ